MIIIIVPTFSVFLDDYEYEVDFDIAMIIVNVLN